MTEVSNVSEPDMVSYRLLRKGDIRYAPRLKFDQFGQEGELLLSDTDEYANLYFDFPLPCYINNRYVKLGLISLKDYRRRQIRGDITLTHLTPIANPDDLNRVE
jgi:hypothetical protein